MATEEMAEIGAQDRAVQHSMQSMQSSGVVEQLKSTSWYANAVQIMPQSHKLDYLKFGVGRSHWSHWVMQSPTDRSERSSAAALQYCSCEALPQLSQLDTALQSSLNISIYFNDNCGQNIAQSRDEMHIMQITIVLMKAYCIAWSVPKAPNWWTSPIDAIRFHPTPLSSMTAQQWFVWSHWQSFWPSDRCTGRLGVGSASHTFAPDSDRLA